VIQEWLPFAKRKPLLTVYQHYNSNVPSLCLMNRWVHIMHDTACVAAVIFARMIVEWSSATVPQQLYCFLPKDLIAACITFPIGK